MTSLKARLAALSVLVLAVGFVALSSGAERAAAPPPPPPTDINAGLADVQWSAAAWGDYDSDGDLDVALTGIAGGIRSSKIYRNNGGGSFVDSGATLTGVHYGATAWGDYDNDGDLDLLLTGSDGVNLTAKIYRNDGGTFTDIAAGLPGVYLSSAAWGDYDLDGDLDILLTGASAAGRISKVYRNNGGTFTDIGANLAAVDYGSAVWGDYDSDGDLDIALSGRLAGGLRAGKIYRNDGGVFTDIGASLPDLAFSALAWGDYDADGRPDLALTGNNGTDRIAAIYHNDGSGAFSVIGATLTGVERGSAAWGDYDSDGDLDLLLTGRYDTIHAPISTIYSNDGGGTFSDAAAGLIGVWDSAIGGWGDYDSDGKLDILLTGSSLAGGSGPVAKIYHNLSTTANSAPKAPTSLVAKRDKAGRVTLSWKASSDSATPATGLTYNFTLSKGSKKIFSLMAASNGYRRVVQRGNLGKKTSLVLSGLAKGTYTWSVQAIDNSYAGSAFAKTVTFTLPGAYFSIKLSSSKIRRCGKPSSATYAGQIAAAPSPVIKVTLEKRPGKKGAWKKVAVAKTNSSGAFTFKKVGKGYKTSVWLRVTTKLPGGSKITSKTKRLTVKACS